jgi:hypothetical protein
MKFIKLIDGAKPYHAKPLPVPQSLEETTETETYSEWAAPALIKAKNTGDVRILTDSRRLHAHIKRKPFLLPKISDMLRK